MKYIIFFLLASLNLAAQTTVLWKREFRIPGISLRANEFTLDTAGNILLAGRFDLKNTQLIYDYSDQKLKAPYLRASPKKRYFELRIVEPCPFVLKLDSKGDSLDFQCYGLGVEALNICKWGNRMAIASFQPEYSIPDDVSSPRIQRPWIFSLDDSLNIKSLTRLSNKPNCTSEDMVALANGGLLILSDIGRERDDSQYNGYYTNDKLRLTRINQKGKIAMDSIYQTQFGLDRMSAGLAVINDNRYFLAFTENETPGIQLLDSNGVIIKERIWEFPYTGTFAKSYQWAQSISAFPDGRLAFASTLNSSGSYITLLNDNLDTLWSRFLVCDYFAKPILLPQDNGNLLVVYTSKEKSQPRIIAYNAQGKVIFRQEFTNKGQEHSDVMDAVINKKGELIILSQQFLMENQERWIKVFSLKIKN